ncbi:MAG: hypothetical protein WBE37_02760 [Bryobacteraceae bacterium]
MPSWSADFSRAALVAGVEAALVWERIESLSRMGIQGGQVYDALIAWCAADAGAKVLLTWNRKLFITISIPDLEVQEP